MRLVLEYGEEHSQVVGVEPPSPNSSSGTLSAQEAIRQAHREFQAGRPVRPGNPVPNPPPVPPVVVDEVISSDDEVISGPSSHSSIIPPDNPLPATVAGGHTSFDVMMEFGDVEYDHSLINWFKFSTAPTEFKLMAGPDGREFLFCVPDPDSVFMNPVDPIGRRTVGSQAKPRTQTSHAQTDATPPVLDEPPQLEDVGEVESQGDGVEPEPAVESSLSGNETTVSSETAAAEREDFLASMELTK